MEKKIRNPLVWYYLNPQNNKRFLFFLKTKPIGGVGMLITSLLLVTTLQKAFFINSIYKKQRVDQTYVDNKYIFVLLLQLSFSRKKHTRNFNQNHKYTFICENTYGNIKHTTHNEKCPKRPHYLVNNITWTTSMQLVHNFTIDIYMFWNIIFMSKNQKNLW